MARTKQCKRCREPVARNVRTCPHCGAKNPGYGPVKDALIGCGSVGCAMLMLPALVFLLAGLLALL